VWVSVQRTHDRTAALHGPVAVPSVLRFPSLTQEDSSMKHSLVLVGGLLAAFATSAEAQKVSPVRQKTAHAQVKPISQPYTIQLPPAPLIGGADACTTPDLVVGTGVFAFDNSTATTGTEGQTEGVCNFYTLTGIDNDVWFTWVAPSSGVAIIETCNLSGLDTKMAAYSGTTCPTPGTALACSDDDCSFGLQSHIQFAVTGGNQYVVQLGNYPGATGGIGQFSIAVASLPANDDCTTPSAISGFGRFAFDNTLATTGAQGQTEALCFFYGNTSINNDVWFTWVAPATGNFAVVTEGLTDIDTKIAVYDGAGCPATAALGCNDDGGVSDYQSITTFSATSGNSYTIQLGLYPFTTLGGMGRFAIMQNTLPTTADSCSTPDVISGQGIFPFDTVFSTTGAEGQTEALCNYYGLTAVEQDSWYLWTPDMTGTALITSCPGTFADTKIGVYAGPNCPTPGTALACVDDSCGPTSFQTDVSVAVSCGQTYLIQVGSYPYGGQEGGLGDLDISIVGAPCSTPSVPECFGDTAVACPCSGPGGSGIPNPGAVGNGCANSSFPAGGKLTSSGIAQDNPGDSLVLTCSNMPGPGLFFQSNGTAGPIVNFNDGTLCAAIGIIRMGVVFPSGGVASYPGGLTPAPIHIAGAPVLTPTPTKHYQCWYRDITPGFCNTQGHNMSNGVAIVWTP
jgi:hypothetical protein